MKRRNIIILVVIILVSVVLILWFLYNPRTRPQTNKDYGCFLRCKQSGYNRGICLNGGSGIGSGCEQAGGTQVFDRDNPIPGCDFESIGSWEECCCF